ncbi:hypothetical protein T440DRAFT_190827 [Plenodomus tracheiphilus IPT5]|uniref:Uncharacterized protein n=1 Tax=Plenodomus tracheiphilus IPT5 TaxID=1408161 RepID=A0A6A7AWI8_9PLEO|nr:hypothetical protein T440DRAFT_190827 [Plenodomus tracheiphilus IPT5]
MRDRRNMYRYVFVLWLVGAHARHKSLRKGRRTASKHGGVVRVENETVGCLCCRRTACGSVSQVDGVSGYYPRKRRRGAETGQCKPQTTVLAMLVSHRHARW